MDEFMRDFWDYMLPSLITVVGIIILYWLA